MKQTIRAALELMRPANILTAHADIMAGFAIAGGSVWILIDSTTPLLPDFFWLLLATTGLYGGGVVMNDYFDTALDSKERPERAIPSGRITKKSALLLGIGLTLLALIAAYQVNLAAFLLSTLIAAAALLYDAVAKHSTFWGPLTMGLCRGGNLMLGVSITPILLLTWWPLALIPILYIGAITMISQGEVEGGSRSTGRLALMIVAGITLSLLLLSADDRYEWSSALLFVLLFALVVLPPFYKASRQPVPAHIKTAVKRGVLSLIILNSALAAGFAGITTGLVTLLLLPLSIVLASRFAVT